MSVLPACRAGGSGQDNPLDRKIEIDVENPTDMARPSANVVIPVADLAAADKDFKPASAVLYEGDLELPSQLDDLNLDGTPDQLAFQVDLKPKERKSLGLYYNTVRSVLIRYPRRAHAAMFPEFEGPGWESDVIAYRLYLDGRNAVDIFGKSERGMALEKFALAGEGYHDVHPYGADVLHVGDALGCGSFGFWIGDAIVKPVETQRTKEHKAARRFPQIVADGPVRAILRMTYDNWPVDGALRTVRWTQTIWGGRRWVMCDLEAGPGWRPTVAVGVPAVKDVPVVKRDAFLYTFGDQTVPMSDTKKAEALGLGVLFRQEHFAAFVDEAPTADAVVAGDRSRVVLLTPDAAGRVQWAYIAAWSRGALGIRDAAAFEALCRSTAAEMAAPLKVGWKPY